MRTVLVGGGSRSGKSRYALELARARGSRLAFLATAQAFDQEMADRIALHREERASEFATIEEPSDIARAIAAHAGFDAIVVDCLTLWVTNLILAEIDVEVEPVIEAARANPATIVFVTNEVGCGIVPENALARRFRDLAGRVNQQVAAAADEVYYMAFGIPIKVKPS